MTPDTAPLQAVIRALNQLHPLRADDEGHFICTIALIDGTTYSAHGILTKGALPELETRVGAPAFAQLAQMVERANSGANMPVATGGEERS